MRRLILVLTLPLLILGVWLGRAALSYYADISICLSPLKIVTHQQRIDAAIKKAQDPEFLKTVRQGPFWHGGPEERIYGEAAYNHFLKLNSKSCCEVTREALVGDIAISYRSTLLNGMSHAVDMGIAQHPNTSHFYISTNICGQATAVKYT